MSPRRRLLGHLRCDVCAAGLARGGAHGIRPGLQTGEHHDEIEQRDQHQDRKEDELHDGAPGLRALPWAPELTQATPQSGDQPAAVRPHGDHWFSEKARAWTERTLSLIHISEPTRRTPISYAVF